jgi:hypothetical protein
MRTVPHRLRRRLVLEPVADADRPPAAVAWLADDTPARRLLGSLMPS